MEKLTFVSAIYDETNEQLVKRSWYKFNMWDLSSCQWDVLMDLNLTSKPDGTVMVDASVPSLVDDGFVVKMSEAEVIFSPNSINGK